MNTIAICLILLVFLGLIILNRKKISRNFDKDIQKINDLNIHNEEIAHFISIYENVDSLHLLQTIENKKQVDNEVHALRKILNDRNCIIPDANNFM